MDTLSTEILCGEKANGRKNKTRKSKKARVKDEGRSLDQNNIDTQLIKHSTEGNVFVDKLIKDEVQSAGQTKMVTRSMKKLAERNATIEKPKDKDEHEFFCQRRADTGSSANLSEVSVSTENPVLLDEYQSNIDTGPTKSIAEGTVTGKRTEKRKRTARGEIDSAQCKPNCRNLAEENLTTKKSKIKDEVQKTGPTEMDIGNLKLQDETQSMCHTDLDNAQAQSVVTKRKTKKKANVTNEKPIVKDELRTLGQIQMHTGSTENLADGKVTTKNPKTLDEAQSMNKWQPAENLAQGDVAQKRIKKRKNKKKAIVIDEFHSEMDTRPENLAERVATLNKPEIKDAERSVGLAQMDVGSTENVSEGNVIIENPKDQDEFESIDQLEMDIATTQSLDEGNVTVKRKKKGKKPKKAAVDVEFSSRMDAGPTEKLAKVNVNTKVLETRDEVPNMGLTQMDTGSADNVAEGNATIENPKDQDEFRIIDQAKVDTGPTQPLADGNVTVKRKKRRKKTKKAKVQGEFYGRKDAGATANLAEVNVNVRIPETRDEVHNMGLTQIDTGSTDNVAEGNVTIENPKDQDEFQIVDQAKVDTGPTQNLSDGNVTVKRKKRRKKTKKVPETRDEVPNVCSTQMDTGSTDNVAEGNVTIENPKDQDEFQIIDQAKVDSGPTQNLAEGNVTVKRKKRRKKNKKAKGHAEGRSAIPCLKMAPIVSFSKKLIVLDINGLLADVVFPAPKHYTGDIKVFGRAVFRRPFCDDFLKFCFQNFNVGIWSSRSKKIIDKVVSYLLGDQNDKLLFCWDMTHCTKTGFNTLENRHKPLVCKELRKIWEKDDHSLPWKKGDFNESNTLLLDDSPYKALLNPLHTTISPHPYQYSDSNDNSLGPGGDLRVYLEGLAAAENVQKYVEQHPFGQSPIGEQDISWEFYQRVLQQMSNHKTSQSTVS